MRFNPKARLDTSRVGDAGRGRRSGGGGGSIAIPGGLRAGGGIGGVIVVVLLLVLTQCLGDGTTGGGTTGGGGLDSSRMGDTGRYDACEEGADANESADCARVAVENSLHDYWSRTLPEQSDTEFVPAERVVTFSDAIGTGCGRATSDVGPFYCPTDRSVYLDTSFFDAVLEEQLAGPSGGFVEPYVLAHEYGHHIQNLLGTMGRVRTQRGPTSDSVRLELQADCYAGMWARGATSTEDESGVVLVESLTDQDIEQAIAAATAIGDDRIQEQAGGRANPEQWTHGSAAQRVAWFTKGLEQGSLAACDTFAPSAL